MTLSTTAAAAWSQWEGDTISLRGPEARPTKFNEIDFAIARTGEVDPVHATAYAAFGAWIRSCMCLLRPNSPPSAANH